ncbi:flagellar protein FlaG [uncultured Caulobacter sp.]|uniref:flagellar protein FlaG n=1 Tax=uncultured Caulobacter sp. TaxID=158749 RepID=UPI0026297B3E|nr:flagellar protein FlaG [uncultured Caulobacter sp.]
MEPKAALSAIRDFIAPVNAPDPSEGAKAVQRQLGAAFGQAQSADAEQQQAAEAKPEAPVNNGPQPGDLRLVIEQNDDTGDYVYKTVDRRTGETLQQFPREEILKLREASRYHTGDVYDGKA